MSMYEKLSHGTTEFPVGIHITRYADGFWLYPHIHREFELLVLRRGRGIMYIDGNELILNEGDGVFVNSGQLHLGKKADLEECEFFAVVFAPEIMGRGASDTVYEKYVRPVLHKKITLPSHLAKGIEWQDRILEIVANIEKANAENAAAKELYIKTSLLEIWRLLLLHGEDGGGRAPSAVEDMVRAMEFIRTEFASPLSLEDMAAQVSMSRGHFCRLFTEVMHETPFSYLIHIRLDNARAMLKEGKLPISEIAEKCGFNSFSYFSKCFKENEGITPSTYAKRYR